MIESVNAFAENQPGVRQSRRRTPSEGGSMPENDKKQSVAALVKRPLLAGALATAAAAAVATPVPAAAEIFLKLANIPGEAVTDKHKDEIEVLSFTQTWINTLTTGGNQGRVQCGAITVMKGIDRASPLLVKTLAQGKHIPDGQLTFQTEGGNPAEYYTIKMKEIFVTEVSQADPTSPGRIVEKVVLNARAYEYEYRPQLPEGPLGPPVKFGINCATMSIF
jgi:type VI secretion system secreted protein Hcp